MLLKEVQKSNFRLLGKGSNSCGSQGKESQQKEIQNTCESWSRGETVCLPRFCISWRVETVDSLKRRKRSYVAEWRIQKCTRLWREGNTFRTLQPRSTFGSWAVEKVAVTRSIRGTQNKKTPQVRSTFGSWALELLKMCMRLWREAHFDVKMSRAMHVRSTFGTAMLKKVNAAVVRSACRSQNVKTAQIQIF